MRLIWHGLAGAALVTLPACTTDPGFGDAVRTNIALHTINPDPQYPPDALEADSGARAGLAQRRYRTGTVIQPQIGSTTSITGFSGGGAGVGAGSGSGGSGTPPR